MVRLDITCQSRKPLIPFFHTGKEVLHAEVMSAGDSAAEVLYAVFFICQTHNCVCGQFVFFPKSVFLILKLPLGCSVVDF